MISWDGEVINKNNVSNLLDNNLWRMEFKSTTNVVVVVRDSHSFLII